MSAPPAQPMTQPQTDEIIAAIEAARAAGRVVVAVEFPRSLALARGPWSIRGVDLIYHSWLSDGFNLKLAGTGAFEHDDEFHRFANGGDDARRAENAAWRKMMAGDSLVAEQCHGRQAEQ